MEAKENSDMSEIRISLLGVEHADELQRVAERDSSAVPSGMVLGAHMNGRLVAARSVSDGRAVADPFVHTAALQQLLSKRAAQLRGKGSRRGGRLFRAYSSSSSRVAA